MLNPNSALQSVSSYVYGTTRLGDESIPWADRVAIAEYLGQGTAFDKAMVAFALAYVERNRADYAEFTEAIASGRLDATMPPAGTPETI